jgi:hypothetical protein
MSGDGPMADLQSIAARFDYYEGDEPNVAGVILDRLRAAHPEATPKQLLLAVRRAEFELSLVITDVDGWWEDPDRDIEDPRWQTLEWLMAHADRLARVEKNIEATVDDETQYLLTELHDELGGRLLVLGPEDRLAAETALPPLVMIVDRNDAGPEIFDQPSLDRLLGAAQIFCVRCIRRNFRHHARLVRDDAMGMAAGMSPAVRADFFEMQRLRPDGPAVLLLICQDGGVHFHWRVPPDAWIEALGARGIDL